MRDSILKLVIAAMLFVSVECVSETVDEASFHQTHHAHADDGTEWYPDSDGHDHSDEVCEHFCHSHSVALTLAVSTPNFPQFAGRIQAPPAHVVSRITTPPTPPPKI
jgi:hypothetical protein